MDTTSATPLIALRGVDLRNDQGSLILEGLDLVIQQGEHTVILGPNGSGKSSLMKILGYEWYPSYKDEPYSRCVLGTERWVIDDLRRVLGFITNDDHEKLKSQGGYLTGHDVVVSGLYGTFGCFEYQKYDEEDHDKAQSLMQNMGVDALAHRAVQTMSTGQIRRLLIARSLMHDVKVLILDEPTNGLDLKAQYEFLLLMQQLAYTETTLLLVTHHLEEIIPEMNNVVLMQEGKIMAQGEKKSILTQSNLEKLFGLPLELFVSNGMYRARLKL